MPFSFDHLIHLTQKPEACVEQMKQLGVHSVNGGHHELWGTYNGLCYFGLSYIEFLGLEHKHIAETVTDNTLVQQTAAIPSEKEGFIRLALRTSNIDEAAAFFKKQGLNVIGPVPGSRRREDGSLLEWAMLFIEEPEEDPYQYPFIIDWKETDEAHLEGLKKQGLVQGNHQSSPQLSQIGLFTENPKQTAQKWERLFQLETTIEAKDQEPIKGRLGDITILFSSNDEHLIEKKNIPGFTRPIFATITFAPVDQSITLSGGTYYLEK